MPYQLSKNTWLGVETYNVNVPNTQNSIENYGGPVTLSLPAWRQYVAQGKNVLYGSGGVIPGGTVSTPFGGGGAVFAGNVRQGIEQYN